MQHVVRVVVPLRVEIAAQMRGDIAVVLEHEVHVTVLLDGRAHRRRHLVEPVGFRDRMHGIEAQPVEAVFHQPVERVLGEELAHLRAAEIDRRAPRRRHIVAEELRRVAREIIPVGPEVVVDHVEKDHQPVIVRGIDERLQLVGRAVGAVRRKRQARRRSPSCACPGKSLIGISSTAVMPRSARRGSSRCTPAKPPSRPACSSYSTVSSHGRPRHSVLRQR